VGKQLGFSGGQGGNLAEGDTQRAKEVPSLDLEKVRCLSLFNFIPIQVQRSPTQDPWGHSENVPTRSGRINHKGRLYHGAGGRKGGLRVLRVSQPLKVGGGNRRCSPIEEKPALFGVDIKSNPKTKESSAILDRKTLTRGGGKGREET